MADITNIFDQIERLDREKAKLEDEKTKLMESARAEALATAEEAVRDLGKVGLMYDLVKREESQEGKRGESQTRKAGGKGVKRPMGDKPCPICKFKTNPLHDSRKHRSQKEKQPFTEAELKKFALSRV
jgi:hypothetical protein